MALWMVRAGRHGEYEERFLGTNRIYITWSELKYDLSQYIDKQELRDLLRKIYPTDEAAKVINNSGQLWPFAHEMGFGDWVVVPSKLKPAIHIAEISGPYVFDASAENHYYHYRTVKWIARDVPRSNFDQDLLYSFGAFMTICRIKRNDAEKRIRRMADLGWKSIGVLKAVAAEDADDAEEPSLAVD